jgi:hypothetical protein
MNAKLTELEDLLYLILYQTNEQIIFDLSNQAIKIIEELQKNEVTK